MKTVKNTLLDRRSIRRYEREMIPEKKMELIYEAIRNTPTSYNGQQFSVIDVTDPDLKLALYDIIGQKQIKTCSHFLLFLADFHKISVFAKMRDVDMPPFTTTADGVIVGVVDAALAMMCAVVAAESEGLGTCCIGYARTANPEAVSRALGLPDGTFVVCGLALGVPRELPDLKPKQPKQLMIFSNSYPSDEQLRPAIDAYDTEVSLWNRQRAGTPSENDWGSHIISYYREAMSYEILKALRRQGFDITR